MSPIGREQGDEIPTDPPIYIGTVNGQTVERVAYTPAEEVNLRARGWVRKETTAAKPAGRPAPAAPSPSPRTDAGDTGSSNG